MDTAQRLTQQSDATVALLVTQAIDGERLTSDTLTAARAAGIDLGVIGPVVDLGLAASVDGRADEAEQFRLQALASLPAVLGKPTAATAGLADLRRMTTTQIASLPAEAVAAAAGRPGATSPTAALHEALAGDRGLRSAIVARRLVSQLDAGVLG